MLVENPKEVDSNYDKPANGRHLFPIFFKHFTILFIEIFLLSYIAHIFPLFLSAAESFSSIF